MGIFRVGNFMLPIIQNIMIFSPYCLTYTCHLPLLRKLKNQFRRLPITCIKHKLNNRISNSYRYNSKFDSNISTSNRMVSSAINDKFDEW